MSSIVISEVPLIALNERDSPVHKRKGDARIAHYTHLPAECQTLQIVNIKSLFRKTVGENTVESFAVVHQLTQLQVQRLTHCVRVLSVPQNTFVPNIFHRALINHRTGRNERIRDCHEERVAVLNVRNGKTFIHR